MEEKSIRYFAVNLCTEIVESKTAVVKQDFCRTISEILDELTGKMDVKSIGLGVPGITEGLSYQRTNRQGLLESHYVGKWIAQRYQIPVFLENDLNAMTLEFGRRHLKNCPNTSCENLNAMPPIFILAETVLAPDLFRTGEFCGAHISL